MSRIGVIGAGAFGTAMACTTARGGHEVRLWARDTALAEAIQKKRENTRYLAGVALPVTLQATGNLAELVNSDCLLIVIPAQKLRMFLQQNDLSQITCPIILCAKGLETGTGLRQTEIARQEGLTGTVAVISGPGFAPEMARGMPTALSIACTNAEVGKKLQSDLSSASLRLYLSEDVTGVQLGGALKNVYAIACGIIVGADLGESARAALMTRGYAEMSRLVQVLGGRPETLVGLSGFGDLALTCTSPQSRNFTFGATLGKAAQAGEGITVEGIATARAVVDLAKHHRLDMPVAQIVADVLEQKLTVSEALQTLMARPLRKES